MQIFTLFLTLSLTLLAQNYPQGKIDMHGGQFDNYNSIGGYKDGGFRKQGFSMTSFLDKNTTKSIKKNTPLEK